MRRICSGDSIKETVLWIVGMLVAAGITIFGALYVVNNFIASHDPTDPLTVKGGLKPEQAPALAK
jgi:hypothetical protein